MIADRLRRWKQRRRIAQAEAEIMSRRIDPAPHGLPSPLVVSLTSYPPRFGALHLVLRSLMTQTVRADRVVLWLAHGDEALLPPAVHALGVEVRTAPDWRCYKKIVPTLLEWPGTYVVTADDDAYYGPGWLEGLVRHADAGVVAHRAHRVTLDARGLPRAYADWQRNISAPERSGLIFPTGVGGVLYSPGVFHGDVCRHDLFQALAPSTDDVWLYWMHRLAGSRPAKVGGRFRITEWPGTQVESLRSINLARDGNDRSVAALTDAYGFPA